MDRGEGGGCAIPKRPTARLSAFEYNFVGRAPAIPSHPESDQMARTPNFHCQHPTDSIGASLGHALFGDPAEAQTPRETIAPATADGPRSLAAPRSAANLLGWLHEPYVKDKVVAVLKSAEHPLLMCEVAEACGFPVSCANRVLLRLHQRGQAARYKLPIQRHAYCRKTKACIPNGARRQLYVYSWVGTGH